jgi:glucokinase
VFVAGDIGGTHARLVLLGPNGRAQRHEVFDSRKYASLEAVVREFLGRKPPRVTAAAFGLAGPVVDQRFVGTNLPWTVDARSLSRKLAIKRVTLLNDLVALSLGALGASAKRLVPLGGAGVPKKKGANIAVIAAGTGLGEALLVWDAERARFVASATEGGHADFAPRDDLEVELLRFLRARFGHVSWERVLSGNGLGSLYDFFRSRGVAESADHERALAAAADRNAAIAQMGIERRSEAAMHAVEAFASMYGAEAGNLALKSLAVGGVYVCGNIAEQMLDVLSRGGFRRAFVDKGRFAPFMERIPVAVVRGADIGLQGAARVALGNKVL